MAATLEGVFLLIDRASDTLERIERQAQRTDRALGNTGDALDRIGTPRQMRNMERADRQLRNTDRSALSMGRSMDRADRSASILESRLVRIGAKLAALGRIMSLLKWPAMVAGAGLAAQGVGALAGGVVALTGGFGDLLGIAAALPATLLGIGGAAITAQFAMKDVGEALGGNEEALKRLNPEARRFVRTLKEYAPVVDELRASAQRGLFPGLEGALSRLQRGRPMANRMLERFGRTLGGGAERAATSFTRGRALGDLDTLLRQGDRLVGRMIRGVINLGQSLRHVAVAARPFTEWLSVTVLGWTKWARGAARAGRESGRLGDFFERVRRRTQQVFDITGNLWNTLRGLTRAARPLTDWLFRGFERATQSWEDFTNSARGQRRMRRWFMALRPPLREFFGLISDVAVAWAQITEAGAGEEGAMTRTLRTLRDTVEPLSQLLMGASEALGPMLAETLHEVVRLLANLPWQPISIILDVLSETLGVVNDLVERFPVLGFALAAILTAATINKFTGFFGMMRQGWARATVEAQRYRHTASAPMLGTPEVIAPARPVQTRAPAATILTPGGVPTGPQAQAFIGPRTRPVGPRAPTVTTGPVGPQAPIGMGTGAFVDPTRGPQAPAAAGTRAGSRYVGGFAGALTRGRQRVTGALGGMIRGSSGMLRGIGAGVLATSVLMGLADGLTRSGIAGGDRVQQGLSTATLGIIPSPKTFSEKLRWSIQQALTSGDPSFEGVEGFWSSITDGLDDQGKRMIERLRKTRETAWKLFGPGTKLTPQVIVNPERARRQLMLIRNEFGRLRSGAVGSVRDMRTTVEEQLRRIQGTLGFRSRAGRDAVRENFRSAVDWIEQHMSRGGRLTSRGMGEMERLIKTHMRNARDGMRGSFGDMVGIIRRSMGRGHQAAARGAALIRKALITELSFFPHIGRQGARGLVMRPQEGVAQLGIRGAGGSRRAGPTAGGAVARTGTRRPGVRGLFGTGGGPLGTDFSRMDFFGSSAQERQSQRVARVHGRLRSQNEKTREDAEKTRKKMVGETGLASRESGDRLERLRGKFKTETDRMRSITSTGFGDIVSAMNKHLSQITTTGGGGGGGGGGAPVRGGRPGGARGIRIPGRGLHDHVPLGGGSAIGAPGELVINRHTERDHDRDAAYAGLPTLGERVRGERRPHSAPETNRKPGRGPRRPHIFHARGGRIPTSFPDAMGALPGLDALAFVLGQKFGLRVTSGARPGAITTSGNPSDHGWGGAIDVSNGVTTPQMDAAHAWLTRSVGGAIKQMLYRTMVGGNHFDHIHVALLPQFAHNAALLMRLLKAGGLRGMAGMLGGAAPRIKMPPGYRGWEMMEDASTGALKRVRGRAQKRLDREFGAMGDFGGLTAGVSGSNQEMGRMMMLRMWGANQWSALKELWTRESGWNEAARNPSSGAYGIPQSLPASKMGPAAQGRGAAAARAQIAWGLNYIKGRYGTPSAALAFHDANNWYEMGGRLFGGRRQVSPFDSAGQVPWFRGGGDFVATRPQVIGVGDGGRERVTITPTGRGGRSGPLIGQLTVENHREGDVRRQVVREVRQALRELRRELEEAGVEDGDLA